MPWVTFDDQYPIHRKVSGLSDAAFRLHTAAIFWCSRNLTNGFIQKADLGDVRPQLRAPGRFAAECVSRGVWHVSGFDCPSQTCPAPRDGDGWVVHDYLEFQETKVNVLTRRAETGVKKSFGGKLGNHIRWHANRGISDPGCWWCGHAPGSVRSGSDSDPDRTERSDSDRSPIAPIPIPDRSGVSVVGSPADRNARTDPDLIKDIQVAIHDRTGWDITDTWARRVIETILGGRAPANPGAYCRKAIASENDPRTRFLPNGGRP
jgi:hypothetical protein